MGYLRVSTEEQGDSGLGLAAQRAAIRHWAADRKLELVSEVGSGKTLRDRPLLVALLDRIQAGDTLIVARLDRLSRSLLDFASILERSEQDRWTLVALDLNVNTATATGRMLANMVVNIAQWERELIGERTRAALQAKRNAGSRLGRPAKDVPEESLTLLRALRVGGLGWDEIATELSRLQAPPFKTWSATTVRRLAPAVLACGVCGIEAQLAPLRVKYPPTSSQWRRLLREQGDRCAVCGIAAGLAHLVVDHDHLTGRVRGIVCQACNSKVGHAGDTLPALESRALVREDEFAHAAIHYLLQLDPIIDGAETTAAHLEAIRGWDERVAAFTREHGRAPTFSEMGGFPPRGWVPAEMRV